MSDTVIELPQTMDANPGPEDAAPGERQKSAREVMMESIAARAQEVREAEMRQGDVYDEEARHAGLAFPPEEPEVEPAPVRETAPEPQQAAPQPTPPPAPVVHQPRTILLDGREYAVTDQQVEELARLGMVANAALHQYREQPQPAPPQPAPLVDPNAVRDTVRKIQFGSEDEAADALLGFTTALVSRMPVAPAIDPNQIAHRVTETVRADVQLARDKQVIQDEYADIFAHPQRTFLAKINVDAIRDRNIRTGHHQSDIDVYREAGNMVRDAMGLPQPGADAAHSPALQAAPVVVRQDVIERKRAAPRITQTVDRRAPAPEAPRAPSNSEIVDRMRVARGLPSMR